MSIERKVAVITGASQGIGAGIVKAFVERGFNVVANSRQVTRSTEVAASDRVALVDGHIGEPATAAKIVETSSMAAQFRSLVVERRFIMTVIQRTAICFAAGVLGALAVVLFSHILFVLGLSQKLGVREPISFKSPDIYRPLFWGGLWGIPFGLLIDAAWTHLYFFGLLYFLAPVLALFLIFLPISGAGYFGLQRGGPMFTIYLLLINLPFGIVTALAARVIIGEMP